jgi:calcium permeable stress-gated cation channel
LTGLVQGVLPQLTTYLVMNLMLVILRFLMSNKGHLTSTDVQLSTQQFYFWFLYAQFFITTSISSGLIPTLVKIIDGGAAQLPQILARNLPLASNYYLSYLFLHIGTQSLSILARIPAIIKLYTRVGRCHTPKDQIDALYDLHLVVRWGEVYPIYSAIGVIGTSPQEPAFLPPKPALFLSEIFPNFLVIIYALLMPLILPIAALTCVVLRFCFRYAILYTAHITVDTIGRLYFRAILHLYWGIITMELALLGLFLLKVDPNNMRNDVGQIGVLLLTILATIQYQHSIQRFYQPLIRDYEAVSRQGTSRLSHSTEVHPQSDVREKYRPAVSKLEDPHSLEALDLNIWLPKDVGGVSDALIESVRRNYIGPSVQIRLTNLGAAMNSDGHVVLDNSTAHNILSALKVQ